MFAHTLKVLMLSLSVLGGLDLAPRAPLHAHERAALASAQLSWILYGSYFSYDYACYVADLLEDDYGWDTTIRYANGLYHVYCR